MAIEVVFPRALVLDPPWLRYRLSDGKDGDGPDRSPEPLK